MSRDDDAASATKGDIRALRGEMQAMGKGIHEAIDQVLVVLINVDKRLTNTVQDHEKRITKLEKQLVAA